MCTKLELEVERCQEEAKAANIAFKAANDAAGTAYVKLQNQQLKLQRKLEEISTIEEKISTLIDLAIKLGPKTAKWEVTVAHFQSKEHPKSPRVTSAVVIAI
jgi:hypothetical protein